MEEYLIIIKYILIFFSYNKCLEEAIQHSTSIEILLVLIAIPLIRYLIKIKTKKIILEIINIIFIVFVAYFVNNIFFTIIPIYICELIGMFYKNKRALTIILNLLVLYFIKEQNVSLYVFIDFLCIAIYYKLEYDHNKIETLTEKSDFLTEENSMLIKKLSRSIDYEDQLINTSKLESRNKISQGIHDKIGHTIAGSIMQLEASKIIIKKNPEKTEEMIQNVIDTLRKGYDSTRNILKKIKPAKEQIGINKVKLLAKNFSLSSNMETNVFSEGNLEYISYKYWNIIYTNIKEALTNASKYSEASKVDISVQVFNKIIKVEVKDNGMGCQNPAKGIGISGMEERVENLGGNIILDGKDGFSIITLLPFKGKNDC